MTARRDDPFVAAVLAQIDVVDRTLLSLRAPLSSHDDVRQVVTIAAWDAARHGLLEWRARGAVRAFLRVATTRALYNWYARNPRHDELREEHEPATMNAEQRYLGKEALAFLRQATTPERWKAIAAYAKGIPVAEIARREDVPAATVYNWIRLAREDMRAALAREDAAVYVRRRR